MLVHLEKLTLAYTELFDDRTDVFVGNVDGDALHRLTANAVYLLVEYLRVGAAYLVALTAHGLDEDGKVHLASSGNLEAVGGVTVGHAEGNVL